MESYGKVVEQWRIFIGKVTWKVPKGLGVAWLGKVATSVEPGLMPASTLLRATRVASLKCSCHLRAMDVIGSSVVGMLWREMLRIDSYWHTHDGSMVLVYMLTWIPSIYPLYVSIYTSTMDRSWDILTWHTDLQHRDHVCCMYRVSAPVWRYSPSDLGNRLVNPAVLEAARCLEDHPT